MMLATMSGALLLDALLGDPRWLPHPVRLLGNLATHAERAARLLIPHERAAGIICTLSILSAAALAAGGTVAFAAALHPVLAAAIAACWIWVSIAPQDLCAHAVRVGDALARHDLPGARQAVSMIVGRDTDVLDETGVLRATLESVGENLVDGVTAALFWAFVGAAIGLGAGEEDFVATVLGAAIGAFVYRASNTMDAMHGHRTPRYLRFGWCAARLDDVLGWLPSRLTPPLLALAAALLGESGRDALACAWRDRNKHASPNSAWGEAALAGALGIRLGGPTRYKGEWRDYPQLGLDRQPLALEHIARACRLVWGTTLLTVLAGLAVTELLSC